MGVFNSFSGTLKVFEKDVEKLKSRHIKTHNVISSLNILFIPKRIFIII